MALQEQWQQDVDNFGEKAHWMWTWFYKNDPKIETLDPIESNYECQLRIKGLQAIRKESAALPFDLERAKAGDAVEVFYNDYWFECLSFEPPVYSEIGMVIFLDKYKIKNTLVVNHEQDLRMKYPPTIKQEQK